MPYWACGNTAARTYHIMAKRSNANPPTTPTEEPKVMTDTTVDIAEVETDENGRKRAISKQEYLDDNGKVVKDVDECRAVRYTLLGNGASFTWKEAEATPTEISNLAKFGAKTLMTNEISQVRNSPKNKNNTDPAILDEAMTAMIERFAGIREGDWNRDRESGPRVNKESLAKAICNVLVQNGKKTQADCDAGYEAEVLVKLNNQPDWLSQMRKYPPVAAAYVLLVGRTGDTTLDDLMK
jgi:hypothetical protein